MEKEIRKEIVKTAIGTLFEVVGYVLVFWADWRIGLGLMLVHTKINIDSGD